MTTCAAHYPLLLDGEPVNCTLDAGHPGDHEDHIGIAPATRVFPDQPECWTT